MVVHIGIDFDRSKFALYDTIKKKVSYFNFEFNFNEDIKEIVKIFNEIKLKINDELGYACISFQYFSPTYKKYQQFIDAGLNIGFKKVQVIDQISSRLYSFLSRLDYQLINFNIVSMDQFSQVELWQIKDGNVKLINFFKFNEITFKDDVEKDKNPVIISYSERSVFREEYFPASKCICCESDIRLGALYKARIMGCDPDVFYYDIESKFGTSLILKFNNIEKMRIEYGEFLPLSKHIVYEVSNHETILTVIATEEIKKYILPQIKKVLIVVDIDDYKKYCIRYMDISNVKDNNIIYGFIRNENTALKNINTAEKYFFPVKIQVNNDQISAVGIDLGTTRCCVAVNRRSGVETVALDNTGEKLLILKTTQTTLLCSNSVINSRALVKAVLQGPLVVVKRFRTHAKSTVFDVKRIIGKNFSEFNVDDNWPFEVSPMHNIFINQLRNESNVAIKILASEQTIFKHPEEISAVLLEYIKEKAEEFQGKHLMETVITVPAAFNDKQKQATFDAAILAGWETVHLLPEPVAAAFAYFIDRPVPNNKILLLFDLGGGTLDICIFKVEKNQLQILSSGGDSNLGGRDFDNLLVHHFEKKLNEEFGIEVTKDKKYKLLQECQSIKEMLSIEENVFLDVEEIDCSTEGIISITRNEFDEMSTELLKIIRENINNVFDNIGFTLTFVQMVLHVGGACRMPMIKNMLQDIFPNAVHIRQQNIDEVVAVGAAYYAFYLKQKDKRNCSVM